jgi:predicted enzyme related to lactoylglutathione lyase
MDVVVLWVASRWAGLYRDNIDDTLARLMKLGARVVDEIVDYEDIYRLCYIRGPEGILIGLAQQLRQQASRENPMELTH